MASDLSVRAAGWPRPDSPPVFSSGHLDVPDLRDMSSTLHETCVAFEQCLRDGDLIAAESVFGLLRQHVPDLATLLVGVVQPLLNDALTGNDELDCSVRMLAQTTRDLLVRHRRPLPPTSANAVMLVATATRDALLMNMVAVLLDEAGVPTSVLEFAGDGDLDERLSAARAPVACLPASAADRFVSLIERMRRRRATVVIGGPEVESDCGLVRRVGASAGASAVDEIAALLQSGRGPLTAAEAAVLTFAADGYTNTRMARELGISVSAVKARLEASYTKLNASDRTHATAIALRNRWIR